MAILECSTALLRQIDALHEPDVQPTTPPGRLGDWCATIFSLEDRRAALFMSQRTLLSFIILEGRRFDAEAIAVVFRVGMRQVLELEGCKKGLAEEVASSYTDMVFDKTVDASRRSQMGNLVRDYRDLVMHWGGLKHCDVGEVIHGLNQRPRKSLDWATPHEVMHALLKARVA